MTNKKEGRIITAEERRILRMQIERDREQIKGVLACLVVGGILCLVSLLSFEDAKTCRTIGYCFIALGLICSLCIGEPMDDDGPCGGP